MTLPRSADALRSPRTTRRAGAALVLLMMLFTACGGGPADRPVPSSTIPSPSVRSGPPPTSSSPTPPLDCARRVLASMTEAQRVGQLFVVGLIDSRVGAVERQAIARHHFGSVSFVKTVSIGVGGVRAVAEAAQAQVSQKTTAGVGFLVAANQEGGQIQALRGPGFTTIPTAVAQGRLTTATLREAAAAWGRELADAGVNLDFAPVMDVVPAGSESTNQPIGVLEREFGTDPHAVGGHGVAFLRGMRDAGVATTAKHFPGLGRVEGNTDFTADVVDRVTTRDDPDLGSFHRAVDAGVPFVMVALATYTRIDPDHLAVFSPAVMQMLRDDLGFDGVIVSDDIGEAVAVSDIPPGRRAIDFLSAGGDMIVSKTVDPAVAMATAVLSRATDDGAFRSLVDGSALRILEAKGAQDLLPCSTT